MTVFLVVPGLLISALAAPPDLTNPGDPDFPSADTITKTSINLGPSGLTGWVYREKDPKALLGDFNYTGQSRQILVSGVDAGSPGDSGGILVDDVILGASGDGSDPVDFTSDARKSLALAIADAEARATPELKLKVWRAGATSTHTLTLQTLGAYGADAPVADAKCDLIVENARQALLALDNPGTFGFGTLALMALDDPVHPDHAAMKAQIDAEIASILPDAANLASMNSGLPETQGKIGWNRGHTLITLCEYYLNYGEHPNGGVFEAIEAHVNSITTGQSIFGTFGHQFATFRWPDGDTTPMMDGYGAINSAAVPGWYGLLLAKQCGVVNPALDEGIDRATAFYGSYAGRGVIPYGEHSTVSNEFSSNGKSGAAALALDLATGKEAEAKYFAKMSTAAYGEYETGHTGPYFQNLWSPLGAALGGDDAIKSYFAEISWLYDLARKWDGSFDYNHIATHSNYTGFNSTTPYILTYALPLKRLHMTGRGRPAAGVLDATEVAEAMASGSYDSTSRSKSELLADVADWSPVVPVKAGRALAQMTLLAEDFTTLNTMAGSTVENEQMGALYALEELANYGKTDPGSVPVLVALLSDSDPHVRRLAARALRPNPAKSTELNAILAAAAAAQRDALPMDPRDPLHHDLYEMSRVLFGSSGGILHNGTAVNLDGVDRQLLYPALRAIANCAAGQGRSSLKGTFDVLNQSDVEALGDVLVDTALYRAPGDAMFADGARDSSMDALGRHAFAEAIPVAERSIREAFNGYGNRALYGEFFKDLQQFGATSLLVEPDPAIDELCLDYIAEFYGSFGFDANLAEAQSVLDAIDTDYYPAAPNYLKSFDFVSADATELTLPANQTQLHASVTDHAKGALTYTWRKVYGSGNVTFSDNGTDTAKDTTITFDNTPGHYLFEVAVIDARGLSEVTETVAVTLYDTGGTLPSNLPPTADPQTIPVAPGVSTAITLTGADPESAPLIYTVTSVPVHGTLSGTAPNLFYTSELTYTSGSDSFTFQVTDSFGQTDSATISLTLDESLVVQHVYEPFDYPAGAALAGAAGGTGMTGAWSDGPEISGLAWVYDETGNAGAEPDWDGVFEGLPTRPVSGSRYIGVDGNDGEIESYRPLAQSAADMAGPDGVLWMSAVFHFPYSHYGAHAGLALTTDSFKDRGLQLDTSGSHGSGLGDGIGVARGTNGATALYPTVFDNGAIVAQTDGRSFATQSTQSKDYLVVLKFEFGATDTVSAHAFVEGTPIDEWVFEQYASSVSHAIDETTLNYLAFSQNRGPNAVDEIRIGDSFAAVAGVKESLEDTTPPAPDPMTFASVPTAVDTSSITMTATTATDVNGVEYYFICTSGNGSDSGWQDSPVYTASGLEAATEYSYSVLARDKSVNRNQTLASGVFSATTSEPIAIITPVAATSTTTIGAPRTLTATIDGSGLSGGGVSGDILSETVGYVGADDHWLSASNAIDDAANFRSTTEVLTYTLAEASSVDSIHLWPYIRSQNERGLRTFDLSFSFDGGSTYPVTIDAVTLGDFLIGPTGGSDGVQTRNFAEQTGVTHIRLTNLTTFGSTSYIGIAEIRFGGPLGGGGGPGNSAPTWATDPVNEVDATEDAAYASTLVNDASDVDTGDTLTFAKVSGPAWLSVASNGDLSGTPSNGDVGANSFTVSVDDGNNPAVNATLNITVINTNDAPVFTVDPISGSDATEDAVYAGTIAGSATDEDAGDSLTYAKVSGPAWLAVASDGTLSGTPANDDVGANAFTVSVTDGIIATPVEAILNITVINTNDAPVFTADPIAGAGATEDAAYTGTIAGMAADDDGDTLTYAKVSGPAWLSVATDGTLSGTPTNADVGADAFTVSVTDGIIATPVEATLNITVNAAGGSTVITPIAATSTTTIGSPRTIDKVIDGSGLTDVSDPLSELDDYHPYQSDAYWLSGSGAPSGGAEELTFELGGAYDVDRVYYWLYTRDGDRNLKTFDISYSTDGGMNFSTPV
ncbi:DUF6288 domain-containing protein, partial [Haloferula sp. A504]|uniref:DUF6288 domain-containing protein n=1 Tax=Haloferula sp. A504 TaxID=3373601 RepID=UPI0031C7D624|nr:DUF6288 domain-containing protein [Verrucomicrobiaceae bacterium E54]